MIGLDIETSPNEGYPPEFALQPWRVLTGEARITDLSIAKSNSESLLLSEEFSETLIDDIRELIRLEIPTGMVVLWNGVFDLAWLHASGANIDNTQWVDAMLIEKWVNNSQKMQLGGRRSLKAAAKRWLSDLPWCEEFIEMKNRPFVVGDRSGYWQERAKMDALATVTIAERLWTKLTAQQKRAALIEADCLVPTAKSWVTGIRHDFEQIDPMLADVRAEMEVLQGELDLPAAVMASPKQLAELLYDDWGLPCQHKTKPSKTHPEGQRAANKTALTFQSDREPRCLEILRWKKLKTIQDKFLQSPVRAREYLGSEVLHSCPRVGHTYTGRMTYTSKL